MRDKDIAQTATAEAIATFSASLPSLEDSRRNAAQRLDSLCSCIRICSDGLPEDILASIADLAGSLKVSLKLCWS